ncbi:hypothetical protein FHETE_7495 [Fusarium heterosporum]|uniref:Uncharacterized protein n=1 Tax=Fusarium heterosporum TaxID=42747 RepID=A0A8H5T6H6_FUSHE|nr:hypothetical protein FHETE_7495 [Fusarium heterosporum]
MSDINNQDSLPLVPPKEPIEVSKPEPDVDAKVKGEFRVSNERESKREGRDKSRSQEKKSQKKSPGPIPGCWENDENNEPVPKGHETIGQGSQAQFTETGIPNSDLMELDGSGANLMVIKDPIVHQSHSHLQPLRRIALSPTSEEFVSLDDPDGFGSNNLQHRDDRLYEENARLQSHVHNLHKKLSTLNTDKQIAEEKAERLSDKLDSMKQRMSSGMTEVERSSEMLANKVEDLTAENRALREQLNDAQSHIFSLQPYRKDLTPEEVGQEYDALVEHVQDWVQKFMDPWLEDYKDGVEALLSNAKKRAVDANRFKKILHQYPDLLNGSTFPETDEDIIASVIMRFLHDNIFQSVLYGAIPRYVDVISFIETQMQASVEPKRDLFSVRTWTAEAYNALLSSPQFRPVRQERREQMTQELAGVLKIFFKREEFQWFCENLSKRVVVPAMKLYEKFLISTNHFYLDINPFIVRAGGELTTSTDFIDTLRRLDCKNVLQNRKAFNVEKLDPPPSKKELYHRLNNICTVVPALYMRQIGQRDAIKDPIVVRKQQMLVAWGPEEKRQSYQNSGDRTLVSHLYTFKNAPEGWAAFLK